MRAIASTQEIRVFVHLAHGFGAQRWQERLRCGEVVGLIDHLPYGYFWAREEGCAVTYSEDENETVPWRLVRMGVRWVLASILFMPGAIVAGFSMPMWCGRTPNLSIWRSCCC